MQLINRVPDPAANVKRFTIARPPAAYRASHSHYVAALEAHLQKVPDQSTEGDRRLIQRWGLASVGLYGSILAGLILYTAFNQNSGVNHASIEIAPPVSAVQIAHR
jgi:hypothetical protein